jgi:protein-L-isoaspartate(D-aspartate) O-methyltransferase
MHDHVVGLTGGSAAAARARMAADLRSHGRALSKPVQDAFAKVPRHLFLPEIGAADAYRDEAFVLKCGPDGVPVSSSSQPAMMAIMLEQLDLRPGHRVLEIGTGSGYNAAVMSLVTGPDGRVTTIDIDAELVQRAQASLDAAGFPDVTVVCADGGYGDPAGAPYDRIIVTAGAWDIAPAWLEQLTAAGRLVLPLSLCGIELSVALVRDDGHWRSGSACRCGFVAMLGAFARPQLSLRLGERDVVLVPASDDGDVDIEAVREALAGRYVEMETGIRVLDQAELADLDMWLTLTEPQSQRLTALTPRPPGDLLPMGGMARHLDDAGAVGIAALMPGPAGLGGTAVRMRGYGPGGEELAAYLGGQARLWALRGRPGAADIELTVWTAEDRPPEEPGPVLLRRPSVSIAVGWNQQDAAPG